jgi:Amt family ammonium transporter
MITAWQEEFDPGQVAWLLVVSGLSLLLYWPGLTLFYAGLLRHPAPGALVHRWLALTTTLTLTWCLWAYSLAFGPSWGTVPRPDPDRAAPVLSNVQLMMELEDAKEDETETQGRGGIVGDTDFILMRGHTPNSGQSGPAFPVIRKARQLPQLLFMMFQLMLFIAVPAPLLVVLSGRMNTVACLAFAVVWGSIVYAPLAHWLWGEGWLDARGAIDSSGGLLHVATGVSALMCAWAMNRGAALPVPMEESAAVALPASHIVLTGIGAALCWVGALFVHSGLTLQPDGRAAGAMLNSHLAATAGYLAWTVTGRFLNRRRGFGENSAGVLAGLASIATGAGYVLPESALLIGGVAGTICCIAFELLRAAIVRRGAVAIFVIQGLAGATGALLAGVFATSAMAGMDRTGVPIEGVVGSNPALLGTQATAIAATAVLALAGTLASIAVSRFWAGRLVNARINA